MTIRFQLDGDRDATLQIFHSSGRLVQTLVEGNFNAGDHEVQWNGHDDRDQAASAGVYFYRLKVGDHVESRRLVLLR